MSVELMACFKGIDLPETDAERRNEIISGRCFLRHLAATDKVFQMLLQDHKESLTFKSAEQSMKNWLVISAVLEDHGLEISPDIIFSILSGHDTTASHLAEELHHLFNPEVEKNLIRRVGPPVALRQRINPFINQSHVLAGNKPSAVMATRVYVQDPARFTKKRGFVVEMAERLRMKQLREQRKREKKEKEEAARRKEAERRHEMSMLQETQLQFLKDGSTGGKGKELTKMRERTEMLNKLEALESAFAADERRLAKLKDHMDKMERPYELESPREATKYSKLQGKEPRVIRVPGPLPFSNKVPPLQKLPPSRSWK